jgi:hypothetical protein
MRMFSIATRTFIAAVVPWKTVLACTVCFNETAQAVRASVFGPDMWLNLAMTLLPLVILGPAVLVYATWPGLVRQSPAATP